MARFRSRIRGNCWRIYFSGTKTTPRERHVYWTDFNGSAPVQLTKNDGMHLASASASLIRFASSFVFQLKLRQRRRHRQRCQSLAS